MDRPEYTDHPETVAGDPFDYAASRKEADQEQPCFYCLDGWVFLSGLDHDGEEVCDAIKCRKCGGTGKLHPGVPE
jgi:hypothetical protein